MRTLLGITNGGSSSKSTYRVHDTCGSRPSPNRQVQLGQNSCGRLPEASANSPTDQDRGCWNRASCLTRRNVTDVRNSVLCKNSVAISGRWASTQHEGHQSRRLIFNGGKSVAVPIILHRVGLASPDHWRYQPLEYRLSAPPARPTAPLT